MWKTQLYATRLAVDVFRFYSFKGHSRDILEVSVKFNETYFLKFELINQECVALIRSEDGGLACKP